MDLKFKNTPILITQYVKLPGLLFQTNPSFKIVILTTEKKNENVSVYILRTVFAEYYSVVTSTFRQLTPFPLPLAGHRSLYMVLKVNKYEYLVQMQKLHNCAIATPATKFGVVSQPNMIDTSTKDQMRNPTVKRIQSKTKSLISFLAPTMSKTLTRAYLLFSGRRKKITSNYYTLF